ncbi:NAD(P)H-dependent oxidoreductase [Phyllobacterium leguminum]|uniref:NAD(P)H dehydrogenase (Quinone) n=1 Tax=Phyllobacterium leguminum TaxID=314237 RepID=A0A318T589_9HYPH|nr:NAD(P)H-dependent oxidoreductase [Phyllobacterium leguminum]PYE88182.1 NAD(P)H dehydrogenase (quinone) [Phyllobacterium leguminum]
MHALIVVSHPQKQSLTHAVAAEVMAGVTSEGLHTAEIADLAGEGFDPRFFEMDVAAFLRRTPVPPDVAAEQARLDRADALVLVYPVYWWSFPGLLKGWIDRVFSNGWAYDDLPEMGIVKKLERLKVHLVAIGGADLRTYARRGYFGAMRTQIEQGIFDYCGAPVVKSELLLPPENGDWAPRLTEARTIGTLVFRDTRLRKAADAA